MNEQLEINLAVQDKVAVLEKQIQGQLRCRVRDFYLVLREHGLVLRGRAHSYYAKQLAQQAVMEGSNLPIEGNEIDVS